MFAANVHLVSLGKEGQKKVKNAAYCSFKLGFKEGKVFVGYNTEDG